MNIIYPFGSADVAVAIGDKIAIGSFGAGVTTIQYSSLPSLLPEQFTNVATLTNAQTLLGTFSALRTVRINAGCDPVYYSTGTAPTLAKGVPDTLIGASGAQGSDLTIQGGTSTTSANAGGKVNLQGGTPGATGAGGSVVLTPGAGAGGGANGIIIERGIKMVKQGAQTAKTVSATLTAAEVLAGIITVNQGAAGASALQLPAATAMDTALPDSAAGDAFDFSLVNISTVAAESASLTTNTGWTLVGDMDFSANSAATTKSAGRLRARKTAAGAWTLYRLS